MAYIIQNYILILMLCVSVTYLMCDITISFKKWKEDGIFDE